MLSTFLALAAQLSAATDVAAPPWQERHQLDFWLGDWDTFEPEGPRGDSQARAHVDSILATELSCRQTNPVDDTSAVAGSFCRKTKKRSNFA